MRTTFRDVFGNLPLLPSGKGVSILRSENQVGRLIAAGGQRQPQSGEFFGAENPVDAGQENPTPAQLRMWQERFAAAWRQVAESVAPGSPSVRSLRWTSLTTPLNTARAALVLSRTVTAGQTGAFLCGLAACAGPPAPSTTSAARAPPSSMVSRRTRP